MKIRKASNLDIGEIVRVGRESFSFAFSHLFTPAHLERYLDKTYSIDKITSSISSPRNIYFVAEVQSQVVGFMKFKKNSPHSLASSRNTVQLQKIYVLPNHTDAGVGAELMRSGEEAMQMREKNSSWLMVYEGNHRAELFYERFGYVKVGKDFHDFEDVRIGFTVMEKTAELINDK